MNFVNDGLVFRERLGLWNIFAPFTRGCGSGGGINCVYGVFPGR